jgi:hypothetical protein
MPLRATDPIAFRREMAEDENVWLVVTGIGIMVFYWV